MNQEDLIYELTCQREYLAWNLAAYDHYFLDKTDDDEQVEKWIAAAQQYVAKNKCGRGA